MLIIKKSYKKYKVVTFLIGKINLINLKRNLIIFSLLFFILLIMEHFFLLLIKFHLVINDKNILTKTKIFSSFLFLTPVCILKFSYNLFYHCTWQHKLPLFLYQYHYLKIIFLTLTATLLEQNYNY